VGGARGFSKRFFPFIIRRHLTATGKRRISLLRLVSAIIQLFLNP
jgi:hypothetical protein